MASGTFFKTKFREKNETVYLLPDGLVEQTGRIRWTGRFSYRVENLFSLLVPRQWTYTGRRAARCSSNRDL